MKIKSSRNGEITLSFTDIGKSCPSRKFLASQICLLTLFAKIKFSRKFPDLQYYDVCDLQIKNNQKKEHTLVKPLYETNIKAIVCCCYYGSQI